MARSGGGQIRPPPDVEEELLVLAALRRVKSAVVSASGVEGPLELSNLKEN